jgi:hypothetical protein
MVFRGDKACDAAAVVVVMVAVVSLSVAHSRQIPSPPAFSHADVENFFFPFLWPQALHNFGIGFVRVAIACAGRGKQLAMDCFYELFRCLL